MIISFSNITIIQSLYSVYQMFMNVHILYHIFASIVCSTTVTLCQHVLNGGVAKSTASVLTQH